mmetsp:Transcript_28316/g.68175  ORF Transcript_28316/g.68175 Transcript_28316/m.68175 type:complete len:295 (-) Transcript_28316:323-1207(-)
MRRNALFVYLDGSLAHVKDGGFVRRWERMRPDGGLLSSKLYPNDGRIGGTLYGSTYVIMFAGNNGGDGRSILRRDNWRRIRRYRRRRRIIRRIGFQQFCIWRRHLVCRRKIQPNLIQFLRGRPKQLSFVLFVGFGYVPHLFVLNTRAGSEPLNMFATMTLLGTISLFDAQTVSMKETSLENVRHGDESPVRVGRESLREERPLNISYGIPVHESVSMMHEQHERSRGLGREEVGTDPAADLVLPSRGDLRPEDLGCEEEEYSLPDRPHGKTGEFFDVCDASLRWRRRWLRCCQC